MLKIALVNMPFANLVTPSIGLTQLKSVLDSQFKDRVSVEVLYLNQDFGHYMTVGRYHRVAGGGEEHNNGIGDWFFRQTAFPHLPDNSKEYLQRYYPFQTDRTQPFVQAMLQKREGLDAFLDELIQKYSLDKADIVGFTAMFAQTVANVALARKLKTRNPRIITVMGGANCESPMGQEYAKHVEHLDFIFSGPALKSFPTFVDHILNEEPEKCHKISGVFSRQNCTARAALALLGDCGGTVGAYGAELDINANVQLDYQPFLKTFSKNFPQRKIKPILMFETSRGCWWGERAHCTFCGLNGESMNYRAMKPEFALQQYEQLFSYAGECSQFNCVDNILPKNYVTEVFPFIKAPDHITIFYEIKANLKEEEIKVLAKARVKVVQPGIEALSTSTLKLMRKGTTAFHNITLLRNCVKHDVTPEWNLLVGFPGETEEVFEKYCRDMPLLMHLPPPSGVSPVRFDRFSPYHTQATQYGLDLHPADYYELIYPFSKETLTKMAYYFADRNIGAAYSVQMIKWLGKMRERFNEWESRWKTEEPSLRPQLYFFERDGARLIHDTRSGQLVEHALSPSGLQILEHTAKQQTIEGIARAVGTLTEAEVEREINELQTRGLLFQENNLYMNLVLPEKPPPMSH